jgi:putative oxidoreductase
MNFLQRLVPFAHWLPRFALAGIFLYHGVTKFGNLAGLAEMMGMPTFAIAVLAIAELLGGLLIVAGGALKEWMTRLAGLIFSVVMLGAIPMVHWQHGWNSIGNMGMEFQVLILSVSLYALVVGNGRSELGVVGAAA